MGKQQKVKEDKPRRSRKGNVDKIDFDALDFAIVDGKLVSPDATLVLKRAWRTDKSNIVSMCYVARVAGNLVVLQDETMGQEFSFDLVRDVGIHPYLRIFDKNRTRKPKQGLRNRIIKKLRKANGTMPLPLLIEKVARSDDELPDIRVELMAMTDDGTITVDVAHPGSGEPDDAQDLVATLRDLDAVADQKRVDLLTTDEEGEVGGLLKDEQGDTDQVSLGIEGSSS